MTPAVGQCKACNSPTLARSVVVPYRIVEGQTISHTQVVTLTACPTCDRPRCNNAGCGMPTGPLLNGPRRSLQPLTCDHCAKPIVYKSPKARP